MVSLHFMIWIGVLALVALAAPLCSPLFRFRGKAANSALAFLAADALRGSSTNLSPLSLREGLRQISPVGADLRLREDLLPPVSIVIVEHDSARRLEQVLPRFLSQQYAPGYQVVVVIDQNDSESEDVLKRHGDAPHLYYTTLPTTSRYLSRKKLGITLGMRAAKHEWVVVTDVHCAPESEHWLAAFARHCTPERNMVLGMTPYEPSAPAYYRFEHLRTMLYLLRQAERGKAFATNQSLVALRKQEFFAQKGFSGNLEFTRAEFEFIVNKLARKGRCALAIEPEARLRQFNPNPQRLRGRQLFALDAQKSLRGAWRFRWLCRLDIFMLHLFNLLSLATLAAGVFLYLLPPLCMYGMQDGSLRPPGGMMLASAALLLWLLSQGLRCAIYAPVLRQFQCVSPPVAVMLEWQVSARNLSNRIRYRLADKNDFITHKL